MNLIVILGPTASGKTRLATSLAADIDSEIISADSRQVYRGMDIGTGKDLNEYVINGVQVPYHLINIVEPDFEFSVYEFSQRFFKCYEEIASRRKIPVMVGGTGLYIESIIRKYRMLNVPENSILRSELANEDMDSLATRLLALNPFVHNSTDFLDRNRLIRAIEIAEHARDDDFKQEPIMPDIFPLVIGIRCERTMLRHRITNRLKERLSAGMVKEVKNLHESGIGWDRLESFGLEYRYISLYLRNLMTYDEMFEKLDTKIHQFSKRQLTWFRRMERNGIKIHWIESDDLQKAKSLVKIHIGLPLKY